MRSVCLGAAFVLICGTAQAQRMSKVDGSELLKLCMGASRTGCDAYLSGIADAIAAGGRAHAEACIPIPVTGTELRDVVVKLLHDQPQRLHDKAARIAVDAFAKAYPCKG